MSRKTVYAASVAATLSQTVAQQMVMFTPGGDDTSVQRIDPILAPGGISGHVHQVFGSNGLSAEMSYESLQQADCTTVGSAEFQGNAQDKSVYWHPALYMEANDDSGYVRVQRTDTNYTISTPGKVKSGSPSNILTAFEYWQEIPFSELPHRILTSFYGNVLLVARTTLETVAAFLLA